MDKKYTNQEKEQIFLNRTKEKYPTVWEHYKKHIGHERMTDMQMQAYNFEQRKTIVRYAYVNTVFYRELYDKAGFHPDQLISEEDWNRVPTVSKADVREHFENMIVGGSEGELAVKHGKLMHTGGSTGLPLPLIRDMRYEQAGSTQWRSRGWWLNRPHGEIVGPEAVLGQNEGTIWRMRGTAFADPNYREKERKNYHPMKKYYLDAQDMSKETMEAFVRDIQEDGIVYLRGYAGALVEFAQFCKENHMDISPRLISAVANPIDAVQRHILRDAFHTEVMDVYGAQECQNMAHECPMSSHHLHVLTDLRHIDILDTQKCPVVGENEGTVHITSFTNYIMPMIRYDLGDRTHWISEKCPCGLPFPLIHRINGRESSVIPDISGNKIFAPASHVYHEAEAVLGYQFVVHGPGRVTIRLVPNKENPDWENGVERIRQAYLSQYRERVNFDFEMTDRINHDNGKLRFIVYDEE